MIDYWRKSLTDSVKNCLESISEECVARSVINGELNIDDRIIQYYKRQGIDVKHERAIMCFLVAQIDDYVRRIKSSMIAEAILDLPVIVRGTAWGHIDFSGKRALLDQSSDFASSRALFDSAPAIIDMSPNTTDAPHDRVLRAAGRGTAFLTNYQNFLGKITTKPTECAFDFDKKSIHALVEHYVLNPEAAVQLGLRQANAFRKFFTKEKYANALLSIIQMKGLYLGGRPEGTQNFVEFPPRHFG